MSRTVKIHRGYSLDEQESNRLTNISMRYSVPTARLQTLASEELGVFRSKLSVDKDIFSELPSDVFSMTEVCTFFNELRDALLETSFDNITLSKLRVSEKTENGIVVDWIYNYFRIYFSFDRTDDDYYGIIINNTEDGVFSNRFSVLKSEHYHEVAKELVGLVINLIQA